jgi:hypothetical protein
MLFPILVAKFFFYIVYLSLTCEVVHVNAEPDSSRVKDARAPSFPDWLTRYFNRINLTVPTDTSAKTLAEIHFAHANVIAYEMLDVFLGTVPSFDMTEISDKLISGRRGGGCTQMNGLLAVVLESLGFSVRRSLSAVSRENGPRIWCCWYMPMTKSGFVMSDTVIGVFYTPCAYFTMRSPFRAFMSIGCFESRS